LTTTAWTVTERTVLRRAMNRKGRTTDPAELIS